MDFFHFAVPYLAREDKRLCKTAKDLCRVKAFERTDGCDKLCQRAARTDPVGDGRCQEDSRRGAKGRSPLEHVAFVVDGCGVAEAERDRLEPLAVKELYRRRLDDRLVRALWVDPVDVVAPDVQRVPSTKRDG